MSVLVVDVDRFPNLRSRSQATTTKCVFALTNLYFNNKTLMLMLQCVLFKDYPFNLVYNEINKVCLVDNITLTKITLKTFMVFSQRVILYSKEIIYGKTVTIPSTEKLLDIPPIIKLHDTSPMTKLLSTSPIIELLDTPSIIELLNTSPIIYPSNVNRIVIHSKLIS